jgi:hypothetical protein
MCVIHGGTQYLAIFECMVFHLSTGFIKGWGEPVSNLVRSSYKSVYHAFRTVCVLYMVGHYIW